MYDADEQAFYDEQDAEYRRRHPDQFEVRDSGKKAVYSDGNQRDDPGDKPRFDLLYPRGMEYEETLLYRVAMHYMRGGRKYGDRNWEKSSTEESLLAHETALHRHFTKFALGIEDGEDHAAAIVWNLQAILYTRWRISQRVEAVMPVHTEESVEAAIQRLEESPVFKTYVFPVKPENPRAEYFNQITVKAASLTDAVLEMEKMLGRETAEWPSQMHELDRLQDEAPVCVDLEQFEAKGGVHQPDPAHPGRCTCGCAGCSKCVTVAPRPGVLNDMPCIDCKQQTCEYGEGRCRACQEKNTTARWQKNAAMIGGPCPDGGACHHGCIEQQDWPCYRVLASAPLSGVMPGDRWPPEVVQHNNDKEASRLLLEAERNRQA